MSYIVESPGKSKPLGYKVLHLYANIMVGCWLPMVWVAGGAIMGGSIMASAIRKVYRKRKR